MASNADFVQYVVDQCAGAGEITVRQMMGDYCIYCDGVIFGLICDNRLYIKETDAARPVLREQVLGKPYPGARDHFYIEDVDDRDYLADIVKATMPALRKPQAVRNKRVKMARQYPASLDDVIVSHENAGLTFRDAIEAYREL